MSFIEVATVTKMGPDPLRMVLNPYYGKDHILYSTVSALYTASIGFGDPILIVGDPKRTGYSNGIGKVARFNVIHDFVPLNESTLLIVDKLNNCIRTLLWKSQKVEWFAGALPKSVKGSKELDGDFYTTEFYHPSSIIKMPETQDTFYIAETFKVRILSLRYRTVKTLYNFPLDFYPSKFAVDQNKVLYLTLSVVILKYHTKTNKIEWLGDELHGHEGKDSTIQKSSFNGLKGILLLDSGRTLLVADESNNRLRVIDLQSMAVTSICTDSPGSVGSSVDQCTLNQPRALLRWNDTLLLIGTSNGIKSLSCEKINHLVHKGRICVFWGHDNAKKLFCSIRSVELPV